MKLLPLITLASAGLCTVGAIAAYVVGGDPRKEAPDLRPPEARMIRDDVPPIVEPRAGVPAPQRDWPEHEAARAGRPAHSFPPRATRIGQQFSRNEPARASGDESRQGGLGAPWRFRPFRQGRISDFARDGLAGHRSAQFQRAPGPAAEPRARSRSPDESPEAVAVGPKAPGEAGSAVKTAPAARDRQTEEVAPPSLAPAPVAPPQRRPWPRGNFTPDEERERAQHGWQVFADKIFDEALNSEAP